MSSNPETGPGVESGTEPPRRLLSYRVRRVAYRVGLYGSALLALFVGVFPLYWMVQNAFKKESAILAELTWYPSAEAFTLANFEAVLGGDIQQYLINSIIVTSGTVLLTVGISLVAGYSLARFDFRYKERFAQFLLFGYMFSPIVLGLPLYVIWREIGLLNQRIGLILALTAFSMPFSVWLMWKYMQTIPRGMEESAWVAGVPRWRAFVDIVLPQTYPAIVATSLFAFAVAWNDFTFAQILIPENELTTFAPGLLQVVSQAYYISWSNVMVVSVLVTIPPLLFAYFLQAFLLEGFQVRTV